MVGAALEAFGFDVCEREDPVIESWFQRFKAAFKYASQSPQALESLVKLQRAIELQLLHKHQAEVDSLQGDAVAKLIESLGSTESAVVQIGSLLLVKLNGGIVTRNLTQRELAYLEGHPLLYRSPELILEKLHELHRTPVSAMPPRTPVEQGGDDGPQPLTG